jgi:hypothetical protein
MNASGHDVTALLQGWTAGDTTARDSLMAVLCEELRAERDWQVARAWLLKELRCERRHDA